MGKPCEAIAQTLSSEKKAMTIKIKHFSEVRGRGAARILSHTLLVGLVFVAATSFFPKNVFAFDNTTIETGGFGQLTAGTVSNWVQERYVGIKWTPSSTEVVSSISAGIRSVYGGDVNVYVKIFDGSSAYGTLLATSDIIFVPGANCGSFPGCLKEFSFSSPVTLTSGHTYRIAWTTDDVTWGVDQNKDRSFGLEHCVSSCVDADPDRVIFTGDSGSVTDRSYTSNVPVFKTVSSPPDNTTRIISVTPSDGESVSSSSPVTIGVEGFLNDDDFRDSLWGKTMLRIQVVSNSCNTGISLGFGSNSFGLNASDPCRTNFEYQIPSSGSFSYSTSTNFDEGLYDMNVQISRGTLFNLAFDPLVSSSTSFKVGVLGYIDNAILEIRDYSSSVFGGTATSSCSLLLQNPFSSTTIGNFFGCIFIPDAGSITSIMDYTKKNILTRVPFGYVTRIYDIVTASTTVESLPELSYTFPSSFPISVLAGKQFAFNPWPYFYVDGSPLKDQLLSTEAEPKNAWQIIEPLFKFLVYFTLVLMVLRDLIGIDMTGGVTTVEREVDVIGTGLRNNGQIIRKHHTISRSKRL